MRRYNSNTAHQHEVDDMMGAMEATLYQHGVDAVFAGHVHAYESSYPVFRPASLLPALARRIVSNVDCMSCPCSMERVFLGAGRWCACKARRLLAHLWTTFYAFEHLLAGM